MKMRKSMMGIDYDKKSKNLQTKTGVLIKQNGGLYNCNYTWRNHTCTNKLIIITVGIIIPVEGKSSVSVICMT